MLLFKLKSQNAHKRCEYCPHQKKWRYISLHLPHEPVWRSRRFLEVTEILRFSSVKAFFHFSFLSQPFQQAISIQDISPNSFLDLWHFLSPVTTFSSICANFFFYILTAENPFPYSRRDGLMILDDSWPARGKGGASHEVSAQTSRKLGRNQWSWSWEYYSHKKQQDQSTGIQIQVFRKAAGNWDIQNIQFPFASEAKWLILISMSEHGVRSRDSN